MGFIIDDGEGSNGSVGVTPDGQLKVYSVITSKVADKAENGRSFISYLQYTIQVNNTDEDFLIIENNSENDELHIHRIVLSSDSALVKVELWVLS